MPTKSKLKIKQPLSKTLHIAIRQAVKDVMVCNESPKYEIDMANWHEPVDKTCCVCMGGATIARRTLLPANRSTDVCDLENTSMLRALNYIRMGMVSSALNYTDARLPINVKRFSHMKFQPDEPQFWCDHMLMIADYIESKFPDARVED